MPLGSPARLAVFAAAVASLPPLPSFADQAASPPGGTLLTLINGWETYRGSSRPEIFAYKGIVHLKGAIRTKGTNAEPFIVPAPFIPAAIVVVKLDLCNVTNGHLIVYPDGTTEVDAENGDFGNAQCFTSLDGVSYSLAADGYHRLKLKEGWQPYGEGTAAPAVRAVGNIVHFQGAMANGTGTGAFVLPPALRPNSNVFIPLDMSGASNGRIDIFTNGSVEIQSENNFALAQNFTTLDGAYFAIDSTGFSALTLINGWAADTGDGTPTPAMRLDHGVVEFQGAITLSSGSSNNPFVLPPGMRPSREVYVPVDMNQSVNGRLEISPNGNVQAESEGGSTDPFVFVSLDGVSFRL